MEQHLAERQLADLLRGPAEALREQERRLRERRVDGLARAASSVVEIPLTSLIRSSRNWTSPTCSDDTSATVSSGSTSARCTISVATSESLSFAARVIVCRSPTVSGRRRTVPGTRRLAAVPGCRIAGGTSAS